MAENANTPRIVDGKPVMVKPNVRVTFFTDGSRRVDGITQGTIVSINDKVPLPTVTNKIFYIANVRIAEGTPNEQVIGAVIWENQLHTDKLPKGTWDPGMPVNVAIQLEGEYAKNATIELPRGAQISDNLLDELFSFKEDDITSAFAKAKAEGVDIKANV